MGKLLGQPQGGKAGVLAWGWMLADVRVTQGESIMEAGRSRQEARQGGRERM